MGGPPTIGRGWAHGRRPQLAPRSMLLQALCPAERIRCLPGPCVLRFREAAGRLPEAYAAPAAANIRLGARSFVLRRPFSSVAKPRPFSKVPQIQGVVYLDMMHKRSPGFEE
ncbi:hypothetical protein NDU88_006210 [Pleurodeles waltl]|uniref:Uncharacterized protein n=1 Tax=Pleurodeles waltl TaxID=8319 RepID=A0AAV7QKJ2_PLEWA|nr:hypothetical protein NDU88_006210 [Pleurodeles waltl]